MLAAFHSVSQVPKRKILESWVPALVVLGSGCLAAKLVAETWPQDFGQRAVGDLGVLKSEDSGLLRGLGNGCC